jgi:anti-sigma factor RsiW
MRIGDSIRQAKRSMTDQPTGSAPRHDHSKARCLGILRRLSAYLDDELTPDICKDIRKHLGACPKCEVFVASLRRTIALCRHHTPAPASPPEKARLRAKILKAAART